MSDANPNTRRALSLLIVSLALPGVVHGCSAPTRPAPPGGGQQLVLDYEHFAERVAPVLGRHGCDATGDCHGGGIRGSLQLSPPGAKDSRFDFDQVVLQVSASAPDQSPILTEPLALDAGGTAHGVKPFASRADSDFVAIREWIRNGEVR